MSADNWGICPKCKAKKARQHDALIDKAAKAYGKVPRDEYEAMVKKADSLKPADDIDETLRTLREDYEVYTDADGWFSVTYEAGCKVCGFKHEFKHTEKLSVL